MLEFISRFGLEHCDLPTMIENIAFLLRVLTVNIDRKHAHRIPTIFYVVTVLTGISYFYAYVISGVWFALVRCRETGDLVAATVILSLAACSITGISKLFYIRFYNDRVMHIVEEFLACDALVEPGSRFSTNLLKFLKYVKLRAAGFWLFLVVNGSLYIAIAIILPGRHFVEDMCIVYGLEPKFETPNYQITFILMAAGIYFGISAETNTSAFIAILTGYTEAQMLALSAELDKLWEDAKKSAQVQIRAKEENKTDEYDATNDCVRNQLHDIVKKHKMIINLLGQVEGLFRGAMTIEFGCVTSALIAELLGGLENTYMQLPYTLLQVTMDCYVGQKLIDASLVLENAVYSCKWENFDNSNQKTVYIMLMNSQKTLTISVGGLSILSFTSLMSVLKSIYSAYTTLRSRM